ncbi:hypothetical protein ACVWWN_006292 [Mycobacterium sp. URHB0021]
MVRQSLTEADVIEDLHREYVNLGEIYTHGAGVTQRLPRFC